MPCFTRSKNFYCCRYPENYKSHWVSRAQKISTVVDFISSICLLFVSRAQKISTVVDNVLIVNQNKVSRAQKISTVVDFSAVRLFNMCFTRSKNFYCCRYLARNHSSDVSRAQKISTVVDLERQIGYLVVSRAQKISTVVDCRRSLPSSTFHALKKFLLL